MFKMQQIIPLSLSFAYVMIYLKRLDDKGGIILTYGIVFLVIISLVLFIIAAKTCYVKAPPNVAYIISGLTKNPRILIGIGGFKIPQHWWQAAGSSCRNKQGRIKMK